MIKSTDLSETDKQLYAELVYCIAVDVFMPNQGTLQHDGWKKGPRDLDSGRKGQIRSHGFQGSFENAFEVLERFPGFGPAVGPDSTQGLQLLVEADRLPGVILGDFPSEVQPMDIVVAAFIGMATHHGNMSSSRKPFQVATEYISVCNLLACAGFLGRIGDWYRWTGKAATAMRANHLWSADGLSGEDAYEEELERIWQTMPDSFKTKIFFDGPVDAVAFAIAFSTCWLGDRWDLSLRQIPGRDKISLSGGGNGVCQELIDRYVKPLRPELN